ncbi:MAG TPA: hypothetical protein DCR24_00885 [Bacillus bacterium]|nr:hypothetical protein [Bacillus sp. (in: firmicutes)]
MNATQNNLISLPFPSLWGLDATIAGRPIIRGKLNINSVSGNNVTGTANFRGTPIPINGTWNESSKQIRFDSPYASFYGQLTLFDDALIRIRHFILKGQFIMKPPSLQAGEYGDWIATTETALTGPAIYTDAFPPVGAFLTSNIHYDNGHRNIGRLYR